MSRVGLWLGQGPCAGAACKHAPTRRTWGFKNGRVNGVRVKAAPLHRVGPTATSHLSRPHLHRPVPAFRVTNG
jgi:hypothetical protein